VLEPRAAQVFRIGGHRRQYVVLQKCAADLADRFGGRQTHRRAFAIEREINGLSAATRLAARQEKSASLVAAFEGWMRAERVKLRATIAEAIDYMLTRWPAFTRFLNDGRICLEQCSRTCAARPRARQEILEEDMAVD
jgi:hypothetical protein